MPRNHLKRFADLKNLPNVFLGLEETKSFNAAKYFGNSNPITLELACGKGEYTVELAKSFPNRNFIGIDRKGNRLWIGAQSCPDLDLKNAAFFRLDVELIGDVFNENSINEIWITFPDPYPKRKQAKKRLTSPQYLKMYKRILKAGGLIHLKTDNEVLLESTVRSIEGENMRIIKQINNLYEKPAPDEILLIRTQYEKNFLESNIEIKYLCFTA
ncbi:MAG: tRNA (guanosine(46)-N7)-methyltransferase TrmB [Candidatus Zixiibacteriota bacterium]|nr:MAG: tRNA (guanosine(46)-N7)-methyltransferase TrmB [candidate division Zixibacteria bacterium]